MAVSPFPASRTFPVASSQPSDVTATRRSFGPYLARCRNLPPIVTTPENQMNPSAILRQSASRLWWFLAPLLGSTQRFLRFRRIVAKPIDHRQRGCDRRRAQRTPRRRSRAPRGGPGTARARGSAPAAAATSSAGSPPGSWHAPRSEARRWRTLPCRPGCRVFVYRRVFEYFRGV